MNVSIKLTFDVSKYEELMKLNDENHQQRTKSVFINTLILEPILLLLIIYMLYSTKHVGSFGVLASVATLCYTVVRTIKSLRKYKHEVNVWELMKKNMDYTNKIHVRAEYQINDESLSYIEDNNLIAKKKWNELDSYSSNNEQIFIFYREQEEIRWFWIPENMIDPQFDISSLIELLTSKLRKTTGD